MKKIILLCLILIGAALLWIPRGPALPPGLTFAQITNPSSGSGATAWSSLTAAVAPLSIANGTNTSILNGTAATDQFFALKNTTAAVVGTSQGSPVFSLCGTAFHGSASVEDCATFKELPGNGNDAAIAFILGHTGTSTGVVHLVPPGPIWAIDGTASGPGFTFTTRQDTGLYFGAGSNSMNLTALGTSRVSINGTYTNLGTGLVLGWGSSASSDANPDTGFSRDAAGVVDCGTGAAANKGCTMNLTNLNAATAIAAGGFTPVSIGTPTQVYNTAATGQNASIGATTMLANGAADRNYRFNVYVGELAQGTTCTVAGSVAVSLISTDPITGNAYTYVVPLAISGGTAMGANIPLSTSAPTVANLGSGTIQFRAKASTNIQFSTTYALGTCSSGQPTYNIYPDLEAL